MLIGYARVSTEDQKLDSQLDALKKAGCEQIFQEKQSGSITLRPEFLAALNFARPGDTICVLKLDRLARSSKQLLDTAETLKERGINLKSLTQDIDTSTPTGKMVFHIMSAIAEFERDIIRERTIEGIEAAKARGEKFGRPRLVTPEIIEKAKVALVENPNMSVQKVADSFGISETSLYRGLTKEELCDIQMQRTVEKQKFYKARGKTPHDRYLRNRERILKRRADKIAELRKDKEKYQEHLAKQREANRRFIQNKREREKESR
jgi:DNA invertase Pin-like site-specific DNA recombinase